MRSDVVVSEDTEGRYRLGNALARERAAVVSLRRTDSSALPDAGVRCRSRGLIGGRRLPGGAPTAFDLFRTDRKPCGNGRVRRQPR